MNAVSPTFPSPRVTPNAWNAFGGVWRLTFRRWLSLNQLLACAGMLAALGGIATATIRSGDTTGYFEWFGGVFLGAVLPVLAFLSGAGAMRDDMKAGARDYLFTRPVRRPAFLVFKFLSHLACVQTVYLFAFGILAAVGVFREIPGLAGTLPVLLLAQVLALTAFMALGFFAAVLVSRYLVVGLVYGAVVEVGAGQIPTQLSRLSMTRQIREMLEPFILQASGLAGLTDPADASGFTGSGVAGTVLQMLLFALVFLALAAALLSVKELSGEPARE